jgi:hypothetical protein
MPLTDPTGSRRFVCVTVEGNIDFETPVDYAQLYAQLKEEVDEQRLRYFMTKDEEQALMQHNMQYQQLNGLGEMLLSLYDRPADGEQGQWLTLPQISARLKEVYRGAYQEDSGTMARIGHVLSRPDYRFECTRRKKGMVYLVKERKE